MKDCKNNLKMMILVAGALMSTINSCDQATSPDSQGRYRLPPSMNLSADEIMRMEDVKTIHFLVSQCLIRGTDTTKSFEEYYIDSSRMKTLFYFNENEIVGMEVCDRTRILWRSYYGSVEYPQARTDYDMYVQVELGSWLQETAQMIGREEIDGKSCTIMTDSSMVQEWEWKDHNMPIQRIFYEDSLRAIKCIRKNYHIDFNHVFPDSLFDPPKDVPGFFNPSFFPEAKRPITPFSTKRTSFLLSK
jgi:hypothetical protein